MPSKSIRGFNADENTVTILKEMEIPKMGFSKAVNKIIAEWHNSKLNNIQEIPRSNGKIIGVSLD